MKPPIHQLTKERSEAEPSGPKKSRKKKIDPAFPQSRKDTVVQSNRNTRRKIEIREIREIVFVLHLSFEEEEEEEEEETWRPIR